jgi:tRNA G26 N,N-dimethylase Trm1
MSLFSLFQKKDPLQRPLDKAISDHKAMLKKWESKQQKEIVAALLQYAFPAHHVHANPNTVKNNKERK